jgi:peptidoglycan/xylan/chitin deacetylase (PgdA/CDA1 family)
MCELEGYPGGCIYDTEAVKRVKFAYNAGHQVASHTWAHKDLTKLSWDQSDLRFNIPS